MTEFGRIDAHVHLWDPGSIDYPWLNGDQLLNRPFLTQDFDTAIAGCGINEIVFVQCEAAPEHALAEAQWVAQCAEQDPRIQGIVAWAPLEHGERVRDDLDRLAEVPGVRGVRRIIEFEPDLDFCLRPEFIAGVRALRDYDWTFDINIDWLKFPQAIEFAQTVPDVRMILDHFGKPPIADGGLQPWEGWFREMASLDHVTCKFSGLTVEANHTCWTAANLKPFIDVGLEAFGPERLVFGGDWPVATRAVTYSGWVGIVEDAIAELSAVEQDRIWRRNAREFYRLPSNPMGGIQ